MLVNVEMLCSRVEAIINETEWNVDHKHYASTGSVYYELVRDGREWVVIRVADHAQYYQKYIKTYSVDPSPTGILLEELNFVLNKPFGKTGDVFL